MPLQMQQPRGRPPAYPFIGSQHQGGDLPFYDNKENSNRSNRVISRDIHPANLILPSGISMQQDDHPSGLGITEYSNGFLQANPNQNTKPPLNQYGGMQGSRDEGS